MKLEIRVVGTDAQSVADGLEGVVKEIRAKTMPFNAFCISYDSNGKPIELDWDWIDSNSVSPGENEKILRKVF